VSRASICEWLALHIFLWRVLGAFSACMLELTHVANQKATSGPRIRSSNLTKPACLLGAKR
jgi:hypothetical protein